MADLIIKPTSSSDSIKFQGSDSSAQFTIAGAAGSIDSGMTFAGTLGSGATFPAGHVLQVISTPKTDTTTTTATTYEDMTGMTVTITPSSTSSKILVLTNLNISTVSNDYWVYVRLVRDSATPFIADAAGSRVVASSVARDDKAAQNVNEVGPIFLDSPSTTSATVYKIQWRVEASDTGVLNRAGLDTDNTTYPRTASSITVMEIAG